MLLTLNTGVAGVRHEESMWSTQAKSSRIGAAHRLGVHETAKAMDIVTRGGGFWSPYAEVAIAVAGACGWSTWSYRSWHHLVFSSPLWRTRAVPGAVDAPHPSRRSKPAVRATHTRCCLACLYEVSSRGMEPARSHTAD